MTYYIQAILLTFIETMCCKIFCETFLEKKKSKKGLDKMFFSILLLSFFGVSLLPAEDYILKAIIMITLISVISYIQYCGSRRQIVFAAIGYYGLLICVDKIMLIAIQHMLEYKEEEILLDPVKATILALLCKTILFIIIMFMNKRFKPDGSLKLISDEEWIRFLFFPVMTVVCMTAFAMKGNDGSQAILIAAFALVFSNFMVFYIIRDVMEREKSIQEMRVLQEQSKNHIQMHQYMEGIYEEQRKKVHEFKNHMECLYGLLKTGNYGNAETYIEGINSNWIEELDYINTNNAVVNSILNQKYKQAKKLGIPILFVINDLGNIIIEEEDLVILLANLLDNAIEACEKITSGSKVIKLRFLDENHKIVISVRNPVAEPIKSLGGRITTTKLNQNEHGIGMTNIQKVADKYGGDNIWSCNEGYFTHSICIDY